MLGAASDVSIQLLYTHFKQKTTNALDVLAAWDGRATPDSAGAAIWEVFWTRWVQAVGGSCGRC